MFQKPKELNEEPSPGLGKENAQSQYPSSTTAHSNDGSSTGDDVSAVLNLMPQDHSHLCMHPQLKHNPNAYIQKIYVIREDGPHLTSRENLRHLRLPSKHKEGWIIPISVPLPV